MKKINVYLLANAIATIKQVKEDFRQPHEDLLSELLDLLPHGSGIDAGIKLNEDETKEDKIVFDFHMDENGYYDGWTEHKLIITPSLTDTFDYKITGRNRNQIKDYLYDLFSDVFYYDCSTWYYDIVHGRVKVN